MLKLVLILTLMFSASIHTCPNMCKCHNYPTDNHEINSLYYTSVFCDAFNSNVTQFLSNSTRDLIFKDLNADEVESIFSDLETIVELPYLVHLEFHESDIENVSCEGLSWVQVLVLSGNHLRRVPILFSNSSSLQLLDLSHNRIKTIGNDVFTLLESLKVLNLSANSIIDIEQDTFKGLLSLKSLDISRNKLSTIRDQVFTSLTSLQYLNISNNGIETLNEVSFNDLVSLQHLDLSWNKLSRVAPGSLHLPSLARLLLAGNPLLARSRETSIIVGTGRKLQVLDASRTGLKQVPATLTHSIRTLRVAGNTIRTVNCGDLDSYPLVQLLDFTSNVLEFIEEDALGRLDFLSVLYLSDNHIREIPKSLPEKLTVLHLEYNDIKRVSDNDLLGLSALEVLLLNDNKIRTVDENAFGHLISLVTLDLSRNPISILQPGCLSGPSALQVLRLASIGIISPAKEVSFPLSFPEHLITLDLSDSPGLARQLLADTAALAASRELQELDLSRANLEYIRSDLLHYLPQLRVLHIRDNSLNCSQLNWLATWMRRQNDPEYRDIICASPADFWGTPLIDLQDTESTPNARNEVFSDSRGAINLHGGKNVGSNLYRKEDSTRELTLTTVHPQVHGEKTNTSVSPITILVATTEMNRLDNSVSENEIIHAETTNKTREKIFLNKEEYGKKKKLVNNVKTTKLSNNINVWNVSTNQFLTNEVSNRSSFSLDPSADFYLSTRSSVNQTTEVAPTGLPTPLKPTVATDTSNSTAQNDNETAKSEDNKLEHRDLISEISRNLFVATEERNFNYTLSSSYKISDNEDVPAISLDGDSTGEMSMFTKNKQTENNNFLLHPGMIILAVGVMGSAAALIMLAAKFTKKKRNLSIFQREDIEVNSLSSVTELW